jgi:hypothetical protein
MKSCLLGTSKAKQDVITGIKISFIHSSEGFILLKLKYKITSYTIFNTPPNINGADKSDSDCNI